MAQLFAHPAYGASFERFVIANMLTQLPRWQASFYRTSSGAEFDLVLEKAGKSEGTIKSLEAGTADSLEAFEIFKAHEQEISIALLDLIMPHLGGAQLAGQIRALKPELPVIFLTGYDKERVLSGDAVIANSRIIHKHCRIDASRQY